MPSSYVVGSHFEQFIKDQISGGRYARASEVVRDTLLLLEHEEQHHEAALGRAPKLCFRGSSRNTATIPLYWLSLDGGCLFSAG
ncbi:type II toxin-antitoxin system ParD family antitoxin [Cyanobium sp. Aljojuca 7D2]|jgi:putative addiction module CopG family antidote|uniref:type II toxin-antitoxin system ParD family antitoxin n=1 Tax=Cyanobium sp. Aljojuca 7D2 TaxID=2823698 RepID=UPI0020CBC70D|nr:type II toxin-antitoxin system ParD family antitoxin [Cyanobium sp. Aljojuca 7D2]MCP9892103.1 type II toxin-antitoxin system ParD family antitoxin [Cyanobium sp. Aljojuca 7D2]